jgi:hypothetical protein
VNDAFGAMMMVVQLFRSNYRNFVNKTKIIVTTYQVLSIYYINPLHTTLIYMPYAI